MDLLLRKNFLILRCLTRGNYFLYKLSCDFYSSRSIINNFYHILQKKKKEFAMFIYVYFCNCRIEILFEAGLIGRWQKNYLKKKGAFCDVTFSSYGHSPIEIGDTLGAFVALTIGMSAATVTFVLEYSIMKRIKSSLVLSLTPKLCQNVR